MFETVGQIDAFADEGNRQSAGQPFFADTRIQDRRFATQVAADNQQRIGLVDAGDGGIEKVEFSARGIERGAILAAVDVW